MNFIQRYHCNPVLWPNRKHSWEAESVFNGSPVKRGEETIIAYRALSKTHFYAKEGVEISLSQIGRAVSQDGFTFEDRKLLVRPDQSWDRFGCEDPRITFFEGKYYIFYTALSTYPFGPDGIKVAVAISDDMNAITEKHLVTPFNAKAMTLFPERINGKIVVILTVDTDNPPSKIAYAMLDSIEQLWDMNFWNSWYESMNTYKLPLQQRPEDHVEIGSQPVKTDKGWLLFYSYIRDYHTEKKVFGVDAILLDLQNPHIVLGRTDYPILTPEEEYEIYGDIPMIVFPSGAIMKDEETIILHYGAADTSCCIAEIHLATLLDLLSTPVYDRPQFRRRKENPILTPNPQNEWEAKAVFNPSVVDIDGTVHMAYRAMSEENTSYMGYASSQNGVIFDVRDAEPMYWPRADFEGKNVPNGNSGCEDPRLTLIDDKVYMLYTAYNGTEAPRVAMTHLSKQDFLEKNWKNWAWPVLISPPNYDNKDACILPEKVNGKYLLYHRMGIDIDYAYVDSLDFDGNTWLEENIWVSKRPGMWDDWKVGISATPVKTDTCWILIYHGVSTDDHIYRVGAILMDLEDPTKILGRSYYPLFEPEVSYELIGQVPNVVFPEGNIVRDGEFYIYYGGADSVVGVATMSVEDILRSVK